MKKQLYPAVLERGPKGAFGAWFPDFPGCVAGGRSQEQTIERAENALAQAVDGLFEPFRRGDPLGGQERTGGSIRRDGAGGAGNVTFMISAGSTVSDGGAYSVLPAGVNARGFTAGIGSTNGTYYTQYAAYADFW